MSCQTNIPIQEIADAVNELNGSKFIPVENGKGVETTLVEPTLKGEVTLNSEAKESLCESLTPCIEDKVKPAKEAADDAKDAATDARETAEDAQELANTAKETADGAKDTATSALNTARSALAKAIVRVNAEGDKRDIVLEDGTKIPFYITDTPTEPVTYNDQKVIGFGTEGDNIVITMLDGTKHDMTRQEFADWLAAEGSPITTDAELANAIANGTGNLQAQIDALQAELDAFNTDQATLSIVGTNLVLRNEDGTTHPIPLTDLLKLSPDSGNLLEMRDNGIYYGIEAPPNLANIYVDGQNGDDSVSITDGGGTKNKPFRTLERALAVSPTDKSNTIHLKATLSNNVTPQEYTIETSRAIYDGAIRTVKTYAQPNITDEVIACWAQTNGSGYPYNATEWVRPVIKRLWNKVSVGGVEQQNIAVIEGRNGGQFVSYGVTHEVSPPTYDIADIPIRNNSMFYNKGNFRFNGDTILDDPDGHAEFLEVSSGADSYLTFSSVDILNERDPTTSYTPFIKIANGILGITETEGGYIALDSAQDRCGTNFTKKSRNMRQFLEQVGVIDGIVRHSSGVPLNLSTNFNV